MSHATNVGGSLRCRAKEDCAAMDGGTDRSATHGSAWQDFELVVKADAAVAAETNK